MYTYLIKYPNLRVLKRPIKRLEIGDYKNFIKSGISNFEKNFDDAHFHRSYIKNVDLILNAEKNI